MYVRSYLIRCEFEYLAAIRDQIEFTRFILPVIGVLDDAAILWIGSTLFVELCPPNVVDEYRQELSSNVDGDMGDVVDAEATDVNYDK